MLVSVLAEERKEKVHQDYWLGSRIEGARYCAN